MAVNEKPQQIQPYCGRVRFAQKASVWGVLFVRAFGRAQTKTTVELVGGSVNKNILCKLGRVVFYPCFFVVVVSFAFLCVTDITNT